MRNVEELPNLSPIYFELWETWQEVSKGKLIGLTKKLKQAEGITNLPEYWKRYPVTWQRGNNIVFQVQAEYYQYENEEGEKGTGYCRTLCYFSKETNPATVQQIANGTHPKNLGFQLVPII